MNVTCDYVWVMDKRGDASEKKRGGSDLRPIVNTNSMDIRDPVVIEQDAGDITRLVQCLQSFQYEWAQKIENDFAVKSENYKGCVEKVFPCLHA
jgi:hypothetical protein